MNDNYTISYSLSPMQQGMLFHAISEPQAGYDIQQIIIDLPEILDVLNFREAWQFIFKKHPILRNFFIWNGSDTPTQKTCPETSLDVPCLDISAKSSDESLEWIKNYLREDRRKGFDLIEPPLMRCMLLKLDDNEYKFIWTYHHILIDGRSTQIIIEDLFNAYEALRKKEPVTLHQQRPYSDFINWLNQQDTSETQEYWEKTLKGAEPLVSFGIDNNLKRCGSEVDGRDGKLTRISKLTTDSLKYFARDHGISMNILIQCAWAILLSRYTNQDDIIFGVTRACRHSSIDGLAYMTGVFINTLPVRIDLTKEKAVSSVLNHLRKKHVEVLRRYEHTDLMDLKSWSGIETKSLFESIVVFENYDLNSYFKSLGGKWKKRKLKVIIKPNYPLVLLANNGPELELKIDYDSCRFTKDSITRMLGHLGVILSSLISNPEQHVSEVTMLTKKECRQLLIEYNDTEKLYNHDKCIHELFEEQVECSPEAIAAVFKDEQTTYSQLNQKANQLASHLRSNGVGPGVYVGIYIKRSTDMIAVLLGILKAGGAYVPLDTNYPLSRIQLILSTLKVSHLFTDKSGLTDISTIYFELPDLSYIGSFDQIEQNYFDQKCKRIHSTNHLRLFSRDDYAQCSKDNLLCMAKSTDIAYVIFTSGSTGNPKGVVVQHRPVINLIEWVNNTFNVNSTDRELFITSLCFDLSVYDVFGLLAAGGSIRIASEDEIKDPKCLFDILCNESITFWDSAPAALQMLGPYLTPKYHKSLASSLRLVFLSGDWIPVTLPDQIRMSFPKAEVIGLGGATEATVWSNYYPIEKVDPLWPSIPYGKPIQNAKYHILDSHLNPCPIDVPGDLYIGGECLSLGYINDAELTSRKYIQDPFSDQEDARLYHTGDMARYLPDGNIQFLGRIDSQVKIRGFRIELGEIECAIREFPSVHEAIVTTWDSPSGDKSLAGYVVTESPENIINDLRDYLEDRLPNYMIPSAFVILDEIPLTSNGKVDRKALPVPDTNRLDSGETYIAPRTITEEILTQIWCNVLCIDKIGVHDQFFSSGGNSLHAIKIVYQAKEAFGCEIKIRVLFDHPTISGMAKWIDASRSEGEYFKESLLIAHDRSGDIPLSFAQQRLWFLDQAESVGAVYNIPMAFLVKGELNIGVLEKSLEEIVNRHEVLRTNFVIKDGKPVQRIHDLPRLSFSKVDLTEIDDNELQSKVSQLISEEINRPFDLAVDILFRVKLFSTGDDEHILLFNMHHIVSDEWSLEVLMRELTTLYQAYCDGQSSPLSPLSVQYADYSICQRNWLSEEVLGDQLSYWKDCLCGELPVLNLPTDRPRPALQSYRGSHESIQLSQELSEALNLCSRCQGCTLFMTLLASFNVLLSRYSGQDDIIVGTPTAGRSHSEIENLLGFFINTLVMRTDMSDDPTFTELLRRVREMTLGALAHQNLPFDMLVEEIKPERDISRNPIFQVMYTHQGSSLDLELPGLTLQPHDIDGWCTSKFDMTLFTTETNTGLNIGIEYNTDLFDSSTIKRMLGHFEILLQSVVKDPDVNISDLALLTEIERHQLLVEWNDTAKDFQSEKCVHELFEEQAEQFPGRIAVTYEETSLTYHELNCRANQMAYDLINKGVGPEVLVGICMDRSLDMIVSLLAIVKAGGAFLPLDPGFPSERMSTIIEDSGIKFLITSAACSQIPTDFPGQIFFAEDVIEQEDAARTSNPNVKTSPENLAYVIYTSGTTGKPKGVRIELHSLMNLCWWYAGLCFISEVSRVIQVIPLSFDMSIKNIFTPLMLGGRIVLFQDGSYDPMVLYATISSNQVNIINCVPSVIYPLLEIASNTEYKGLESLEVLALGGEATNIDKLKEWLLSANCKCVFANIYGPTECADISIAYKLLKNSLNDIISVPIGKPIPNLQAYIVDQHMRLVPPGVNGELVLAGQGLARDYLGDPELTNQKFVNVELSEGLEVKVYRTGDLARYLPDGNIEFLGRRDHQVKIRGFRIELGEIETALISHEDVKECVVMCNEDAVNSEKQLVACFAGESSISTLSLRRFLKNKLPDYMIPSRFFQLERMPISANGKVDRKALLSMELITPQAHLEIIKPKTETEVIVADIWQGLLGLESLSTSDNFFDLGGHSLLVIKAISLIETKINIRIPVKAFISQTLSQIAAGIDDGEFSAD